MNVQRIIMRVLTLLDALAGAGITPSSARAIHEFAYFSNVLAPVFKLSPMDTVLLKRKSGPYYPELQQTIDRLVGQGLVEVLNPRYELDKVEQRYRMDASYRLCRPVTTPALERYRALFENEANFIAELAVAYSAIQDQDQGRIALSDACYSNPSVDENHIIDFSQVYENYSSNAAMAFAPGQNLMPEERLYLYFNYLQMKYNEVY